MTPAQEAERIAEDIVSAFYTRVPELPMAVLLKKNLIEPITMALLAARAQQQKETIEAAGAAVCTDCRRGHPIEQRDELWYHGHDWCDANSIYSACGYSAIRRPLAGEERR